MLDRIIVAKLTCFQQLLITLLKGYLSVLCLIHTLGEVNECRFKTFLDQVCRTLSGESIVIITRCRSEEELRNSHHDHRLCLKGRLHCFELRLLLCV